MSLIQKIKAVLLIIPMSIALLITRFKTVEQNYWYMQKWSNRILKFLGYDLKSYGIDNIPKDTSIFFVCNHQGTIDPLLIVGTCNVPLALISKKENEKIPFFGFAAKQLDTIHFDRNTREGNVYMLRESLRRLKSNRNILIFPEGTRSKGDTMNEFKMGALQPAYMAKCCILPVTINNAYCIDIKSSSNKMSIHYGKPYYYTDYKDINMDTLSDMLHKDISSNIINYNK